MTSELTTGWAVYYAPGVALTPMPKSTTTDFEWFPVFAARVEGDVYRGREGIETFLGEIEETWEGLSPLPEEYRDLGDRVLALGRLRTRGRASGVGDLPIAPSGLPRSCVHRVAGTMGLCSRMPARPAGREREPGARR
jgi:hypothetical protein